MHASHGANVLALFRHAVYPKPWHSRLRLAWVDVWFGCLHEVFNLRINLVAGSSIVHAHASSHSQPWYRNTSQMMSHKVGYVTRPQQGKLPRTARREVIPRPACHGRAAPLTCVRTKIEVLLGLSRGPRMVSARRIMRTPCPAYLASALERITIGRILGQDA